MKVFKEDSMRHNDHLLDLCSAVEELQSLSSREMNKLLRDSDNYTLRMNTGKGLQIDMEKLAGCLPLHLLAVLLSTGAELRLKYLLRGVRLLHSLGDLASRHPKLEQFAVQCLQIVLHLPQILLEDFKTTEQILDLVFYMLVFLARLDQEGRIGSYFTLHHTALVACTLHLLTAFVSPQWQDVVNVLLAHSKVDIFMDAAFDAVKKALWFFQVTLRALNAKILSKKTTIGASERTAHTASQQCEGSLQVLQFLCAQKLFRERLLKNKELCRNGGILSLVSNVLKFQMPSSFTDSPYIVASVSRLKSKVLSILLQICETESFSYLDEVASSSRSMRLALSVASEVLDLLKVLLRKEQKQDEGSSHSNFPKGLVLLNSMRLADIFSDDSNFRSFIMDGITQDLAEISALHPGDFFSSWCTVDSQAFEEDATLVYDPFRAAGAAMQSLKGGGFSSSGMAAGHVDEATTCTLVGNCTTATMQCQQRTTFLVKLFANLHCYVPDICKEQEKDQFFRKFLVCLGNGPLNPASKLYFWSEAQTAVRICENLCNLWDCAMPLIPSLLNEEDVQLLSEFLVQLHQSICPGQPRNGAIKEEPMVEFLREKHDSKFKGMFEKHQQFECWTKSQNSPELDQKEQINMGISIDQDTENRPSVEKIFEKDVHQISEEALSTGGYRPSSLRKEEATGAEECTSLHEVKKEPEENDEINDTNNVAQTVDLQEVDQLKEMQIEQATTKNEIVDPEENQKEAINSSTRSEAESAAEIDQHDNPLEIRNMDNSMTMDKGYFYDQDTLREPEDNQTFVDGGKEDEGIVSMAQAIERVDTSIGEDKLPKKRKRNVMNEQQIALIETALRDEPDMQRSVSSLQLWTEKLRDLGSSDLTTSQLKNWLNNRKARLARAARESRTSDGENISDKLCLPRSSPAMSGEHGVMMGSFYDSPESNTGEDFFGTSAGTKRGNKVARFSTSINSRSSPEDLPGMSPVDFEFTDHSRMTTPLHSSVRFVRCEVGQLVSLRDMDGVEVAQGIVHQVEGRWHGIQLDEQGLCAVEIKKLRVDRREMLPHASDVSGSTYEEAETLNGRMIVVWDTPKIFLMPATMLE